MSEKFILKERNEFLNVRYCTSEAQLKKNVKFLRIASIVTCVGIVSYERNRSETDNLYIIVRKATFLYCETRMHIMLHAHKT